MAFDSDEEEKRRAGKSDPSELGKLAAELPASARRSSAPPGSDAGETLDKAALAALSKGQAARRSAIAPPARKSSFGWLIGLAIGFAAGVLVGGVLFPQTSVVTVPGPARTSEQDAQLAAAEARARKADEIAAAVRPLPAQRIAEQAQPAAAAAAPPSAAEPAPAPATDPPPVAAQAAVPLQPTAAVANATSKNPPPPAAHAREAARAATAALNAGTAKPPDLNAPQLPPAAQPSAAGPVVAPAAPPVGPDGRSVDDLLDQALSSSSAKQEQERSARADRAVAAANTIPVVPSRDDVTRAMTILLPAIRGCAAGQSGLATVGIVVKNDGRVENVSVTGAPFEGDRSGKCMEGVVRHAKFPRFQQSSFRIQFPFAIQ